MTSRHPYTHAWSFIMQLSMVLAVFLWLINQFEHRLIVFFAVTAIMLLGYIYTHLVYAQDPWMNKASLLAKPIFIAGKIRLLLEILFYAMSLWLYYQWQSLLFCQSYAVAIIILFASSWDRCWLLLNN